MRSQRSSSPQHLFYSPCGVLCWPTTTRFGPLFESSLWQLKPRGAVWLNTCTRHAQGEAQGLEGIEKHLCPTTAHRRSTCRHPGRASCHSPSGLCSVIATIPWPRKQTKSPQCIPEDRADNMPSQREKILAVLPSYSSTFPSPAFHRIRPAQLMPSLRPHPTTLKPHLDRETLFFETSATAVTKRKASAQTSC